MIQEIEKLQKEGDLQQVSDYIVSIIDDIPNHQNAKEELEYLYKLFQNNSELVGIIGFDSFPKFLDLSYKKDHTTISKAILTLFSHKGSAKEGKF